MQFAKGHCKLQKGIANCKNISRGWPSILNNFQIAICKRALQIVCKLQFICNLQTFQGVGPLFWTISKLQFAKGHCKLQICLQIANYLQFANISRGRPSILKLQFAKGHCKLQICLQIANIFAICKHFKG